MKRITISTEFLPSSVSLSKRVLGAGWDNDGGWGMRFMWRNYDGGHWMMHSDSDVLYRLERLFSDMNTLFKL